MKHFLPLIFVLGISGCFDTDKLLGPSDTDIANTQKQLDNTPKDTKEYNELSAKLDKMIAARETVDNAVETGGGLLNTVVPGAGALILGVYGLVQRGRRVKEEIKKADYLGAAKSTITGVEDIRDLIKEAAKQNPAIAELKEKIDSILKTSHTRAGTEYTVETIRTDIKSSNIKS